MTSKSEDDIILELILRGEQEDDILDHLAKHNMMDVHSIDRVKAKIIESRAAAAFQPRHAPTRRIRSYGVFLIIVAIITLTVFTTGSLNYVGRYNPSGYAFMILVIGIILVIWPDKGMDKF